MKRHTGVALLVAGLTLSFAPHAGAITYPDKGAVKPADAPYVVSMWLVDENHDRMSDGFLCTGALIDAYTVMPAAHCLEATAQSNGFIFVRAQDNKQSRGEILIPRESVSHEQYDTFAITNDIALISLYYPASTKTFLNIPTKKQAAKMLSGKSTLYGWGLLQNGVESNYLRKARLDYLQNYAINDYPSFDTRTQIGAAHFNKNDTMTGACSGDSGGPLVGTLSKKYYELGIVSYGVDTSCTAHSPTVFTRVSAYASWILQKVSAFAQSRLADEVSITGTRFVNSKKKPLLTQGGFNGGIRYRSYTSYLVTENMGDVTSDIKSLVATTYSENNPDYDISIDVISKAAWDHTDCGFVPQGSSPVQSTHGAMTSLTLAIRNATQWKSEILFNFSGGCVSQNGDDMYGHTASYAALPDGCAAKIYPNPLGFFRIGLTRQCLANPASSYIRVEMSSAGVTDIEPGFDLWMGAMNLDSPG